MGGDWGGEGSECSVGMAVGWSGMPPPLTILSMKIIINNK